MKEIEWESVEEEFEVEDQKSYEYEDSKEVVVEDKEVII